MKYDMTKISIDQHARKLSLQMYPDDEGPNARVLAFMFLTIMGGMCYSDEDMADALGEIAKIAKKRAKG